MLQKIVGWEATALDGSPGLGRVAFDVRKPNTRNLCWVFEINVGLRFA